MNPADTAMAIACDFAFRPMVCPACGGEPRLSSSVNPFEDSVKISASCHGSHETLTVNGLPLRLGTADAKIREWARNLFVADANPDVRELLHYNRDVTPEARR